MAEDLKNADTPKPGHNGYDGQKLKLYLDRIENIQDDIDGEMAEARERCAPKRQDMKDVKDEACEKCGVTKKVLSAEIRRRRLMKQALLVPSKLDEDQQESLEQVCHALGGLKDTPLGQAVLAENDNTKDKEAA